MRGVCGAEHIHKKQKPCHVRVTGFRAFSNSGVGKVYGDAVAL